MKNAENPYKIRLFEGAKGTLADGFQALDPRKNIVVRFASSPRLTNSLFFADRLSAVSRLFLIIIDTNVFVKM